MFTSHETVQQAVRAGYPTGLKTCSPESKGS